MALLESSISGQRSRHACEKTQRPVSTQFAEAAYCDSMLHHLRSVLHDEFEVRKRVSQQHGRGANSSAHVNDHRSFAEFMPRES